MRKPFGFLLISLFLVSVVSFAQKKDFTFNDIFRRAAPGFLKTLPSVNGWADDDHYIEWKKEGEQSGFVAVDVKTGKWKPYTPEIPPQVFIQENDIYIKQGTEPARQLTHNVEPEKNPLLSPDGKWVGFTRNNNLFAVEIATAKEIQFTSDGSDLILNGYASWVYYEEILGRATQYKAFWWSPDSKHISFMRFDDTQVPVFPIYYADGQHGFLEKTHYPKVGDKNPEVKIGVVSVEDPSVIWAEFNEKDDQYFGMPVWTPEGQLWVQWMPRSQDNLKVYEIDLSNGGKKEIYDEKQKTWIDLDNNDRITFVPDTKNFLIMSDKTGWAQLYLYDFSGKLMNRVTEGAFTVTSIIRIDAKTRQVYFMARKENSAREDFYKAGLNGKGLKRLTFGDFNHKVDASPHVKYFITTYSNIENAPKMAIVDAKGKIVREIGDIRGPAFNDYNIPKTAMVRVKSADELFDLPMTITYPTHFDPAKKYPVLISIYGGPNAGTVYDTWKNPSVIAWWAQEGIIQVAMDNRSSGHFGKMGMNYIYRQLGKYEIEDYIQCARWLKQKPFVDGSKICITGASFGGYMTCMALTYGAGEFNYGVANSSVTDWKLYDTHYTERFMDTPAENPEGYKNTAVMTYTDRYKGLLRIIHGTTDDNVHMQNSIQLIDKLEDEVKHFEFMLYPGERHGIGSNNRAKGWHNRLETYRFFYRNLLNKNMPEEFNR